MTFSPRIAWISFLAAAFVFSFSPTVTAQSAQIQYVAVVKSGGITQIEIETSRRVVPLTQVVTDPDRLVIDFSDAVPGPQLRTVAGGNGEVKGVRVGKVTVNPPVTRIVVDLKSPQPFQLFPSSKSVIVKIGDGGASATSVAASSPAVSSPKVAEAAPARPAATPIATPAVTLSPTRVASPAPAPVATPAAVRIAPAVMTTPTISVSRAPVAPGPSAEIRRVAALKSGGATEIEIETSQRVEPTVQAITGPDRLVIDFPQSTPGPQLRALAVNQGEVKGVRVSLLSAKPPVTRVVLDLKSAQAYQIFPSTKSVIVKLPDSMGRGSGTLTSPQIAAEPPTPTVAPPQPKKVDISFQDGRLSVTSRKASLAEVLNELRIQTGADIVVPPGAEQELVAVVLGPSSPRDVISRLLDGSRYNFIIVGTDKDANQVERVVLSPKASSMTAESQPPIPQTVPLAQMQESDRSAGPAPSVPPPPTEDVQPQGDSVPPDTTPQPGDPQPAPN
jgi:hypothetical protein